MNDKYAYIREKMLEKEEILSSYACKSTEAVRIEDEFDNDIRPEFSRDTDRIIYSLSYTRYIDKTQVYSSSKNDNISKRMTHVQYVSKVARTIARALSLNEDLCEAIALGHDIGHTPFGHSGEHILSDISLRNMGIGFAHNLNSVRVLKDLEQNGKGKNLTIQVLDGIMCHNGELVQDKYAPKKKTKKEFLREYEMCRKDNSLIKNLVPMTLEGCIVRISDIIGYIGKDIEDAIRLNKFDIDMLPTSIASTVGNTNSKMVNNIIMDIIENSMGKEYISMSPDMFRAITMLKEFNYQSIYAKADVLDKSELYVNIFNGLFDVYMKALNNEDNSNDIYSVFLNGMDNNYVCVQKKEQLVIDYLSGMTDNFIKSQYDKYILTNKK